MCCSCEVVFLPSIHQEYMMKYNMWCSLYLTWWYTRNTWWNTMGCSCVVVYVPSNTRTTWYNTTCCGCDVFYTDHLCSLMHTVSSRWKRLQHSWPDTLGHIPDGRTVWTPSDTCIDNIRDNINQKVISNISGPHLSEMSHCFTAIDK